MGTQNSPKEPIPIRDIAKRAGRLIPVALAVGALSGEARSAPVELTNPQVETGITQIVNQLTRDEALMGSAAVQASPANKDGTVSIAVSTRFEPQGVNRAHANYNFSFVAKQSIERGRIKYDAVERFSASEDLIAKDGTTIPSSVLIAEKDDEGNWVLTDTTRESSDPEAKLLHSRAVVGSHSSTSPGEIHITLSNFNEFKDQILQISQGIAQPVKAATGTPEPLPLLFSS